MEVCARVISPWQADCAQWLLYSCAARCFLRTPSNSISKLGFQETELRFTFSEPGNKVGYKKITYVSSYFFGDFFAFCFTCQGVQKRDKKYFDGKSVKCFPQKNCQLFFRPKFSRIILPIFLILFLGVLWHAGGQKHKKKSGRFSEKSHKTCTYVFLLFSAPCSGLALFFALSWGARG